jgi:hypothetical protein
LIHGLVEGEQARVRRTSATAARTTKAAAGARRAPSLSDPAELERSEQAAPPLLRLRAETRRWCGAGARAEGADTAGLHAMAGSVGLLSDRIDRWD